MDLTHSIPVSERLKLTTLIFDQGKDKSTLFDIRRAEADLQENLVRKRFELKTVTWHGLTNDEPLIFKKIIEACFNNPDRKKFPFFSRKKAGVISCAINQIRLNPFWIV